MELRSTFQSIISLHQEGITFCLAREKHPTSVGWKPHRDCYWHSPLRKVIIIGTYD